MPRDIDDNHTQDLQRLFPSSISLSKNSKGYTWEIKLRCVDGQEEELVARIKALDTSMAEKFKSGD